MRSCGSRGVNVHRRHYVAFAEHGVIEHLKGSGWLKQACMDTFRDAHCQLVVGQRRHRALFKLHARDCTRSILKFGFNNLSIDDGLADARCGLGGHTDKEERGPSELRT